MRKTNETVCMCADERAGKQWFNPVLLNPNFYIQLVMSLIRQVLFKCTHIFNKRSHFFHLAFYTIYSCYSQYINLIVEIYATIWKCQIFITRIDQKFCGKICARWPSDGNPFFFFCNAIHSLRTHYSLWYYRKFLVGWKPRFQCGKKIH